MKETIKAAKDLSANEQNALLKEEYKVIVKNSNIYFYNPYHWLAIGDGEYDYVFESLYFKSLSLEALKLAQSSGYGTLQLTKRNT